MSYDPLALAVMVAYCGWDPTVPIADGVVSLDGDGTRWVFLPSLHVTGVSSVVVTNCDQSTYTATIGPGQDVGWSEDGTLEWQSSCNGGYWPQEKQSIAVTYSGGYAQVPDDLDAALTHLTGRVGGVNGAVSKRLGSASFSYAQNIANGGLLLVEQMVFDRYRLPRAR